MQPYAWTERRCPKSAYFTHRPPAVRYKKPDHPYSSPRGLADPKHGEISAQQRTTTTAQLTRLVRGVRRSALRYDDFATARASTSATPAQDGHAWTLAYRYPRSARLTGGVEWLRITANRDLWTDFYGALRRAAEREIRFRLDFALAAY